MTKLPNIIIACPVYQRAWILPTWLDMIAKQDYPKENIGFIFELGPDDDETHEILWQFQMDHPEYLLFDGQILMTIAHSAHNAEGWREWSQERYYNMVTMRNNLLERATSLENHFDFYFSLDSDILLEDPQTLRKLVQHAEEEPEGDVFSPLMYMTPMDTNYPSAMTWIDKPGHRATRNLDLYYPGQRFRADIVMAAVFMRKEIFTTCRYQWHRQGEDLGFARSLSDAGYKSYATWDIYCPHIMSEQLFEDYLRQGFDARKPI